MVLMSETSKNYLYEHENFVLAIISVVAFDCRDQVEQLKAPTGKYPGIFSVVLVVSLQCHVPAPSQRKYRRHVKRSGIRCELFNSHIILYGQKDILTDN